MIKRIYLLTILVIASLLTGCGNKMEKMSRIEIRNENSTDVVTLEELSQGDVDDFFDDDEWTEYENFDEKLVPEYVIELYQEKTHTRMQSDKENTYEKIMEYTTYKDSDIVKVVISKDTIKSGSVSEGDLTFYYKGSEKFFSAIKWDE